MPVMTYLNYQMCAHDIFETNALVMAELEIRSYFNSWLCPHNCPYYVRQHKL